MIAEIITISPEVQSGTPVFEGTRVPIRNLFDYLKGGDTVDDFLNDFPSVSKAQVERLLALVVDICFLNVEDENLAIAILLFADEKLPSGKLLKLPGYPSSSFRKSWLSEKFQFTTEKRSTFKTLRLFQKWRFCDSCF